MLNKRKAMIGYGVYTIGKLLVKLKTAEGTAEKEEDRRRSRPRSRCNAGRDRLLAQAPRERRVDGLGTADAVVVGAGIAGCAAARKPSLISLVRTNISPAPDMSVLPAVDDRSVAGALSGSAALFQ